MSEALSPIVYQVATGGILGFLMGYAVKKVLKVVAVIIGLFALVLLYLANQGIINVNFGKLAEITEGAVGNLGGGASQLLVPIIANLPFAGSAILGLALGLKKG